MIAQNTRLEQMLRKFFTDKHGHVVIAQKPNLPIIVWALSAILSHLVSDTGIAHGLQVASHTALFVWAILELGWGASYFRRVLGLAVLAWSVTTLFG